MEQILEKLFESPVKVRVMRLLVRNPEELLTVEAIVKRGQVSPASARRELKKLLGIGLIKNKPVFVRETKKAKANKSASKVKAQKTVAYFVNSDFRLLSELQSLIIKDAVASRKKLLSKIRPLGEVKIAIISGIFVNSEKSRTDLLIVGDNIRRSRLGRFLAEIESELGRPLQYTVMDSDEFKYRTNMYDRFLRDILELPHEKLINKLKI